MNTLVKTLAAAATALALAAAVTISAADAPASLDLASAGVDIAAADYAVDMGAEFAPEDNTEHAFLFLLILFLSCLGAMAVAGTIAAVGMTT